MKEVLNKLFEYQSLPKKEAREILVSLAQGKYNNSEMAAFLTVYLMRSITVDELAGFRDAMLELCTPLDTSDYSVIDLCGTGGDGKNTFNISTLSSFVVAASGQKVTKHGNNSVSSVCGSSNLLAHFGYQFTNNKDTLIRNLEELGICFLHAPLFHPAMKNVAPIRKELGIKTFFNMLGPMVNPASPENQLVGVFNLELARLYGYLYQQTNKNFAIIHSLDGYDEVSLTGPFKIITRDYEKIVSPNDLGLKSIDQKALHGGKSVEDSAKMFTNILSGNGSQAQNDVVLANAGLAIYVGKKLSSIHDGIIQAKEALESGKAYAVFKKLVSTQQNTYNLN
ncbi:MAG TPA: anthranilate phosphoribosyltransferase [Cyclobacteriaceae bacterium]